MTKEKSRGRKLATVTLACEYADPLLTKEHLRIGWKLASPSKAHSTKVFYRPGIRPCSGKNALAHPKQALLQIMKRVSLDWLLCCDQDVSSAPPVGETERIQGMCQALQISP